MAPLRLLLPVIMALNPVLASPPDAGIADVLDGGDLDGGDLDGGDEGPATLDPDGGPPREVTRVQADADTPGSGDEIIAIAAFAVPAAIAGGVLGFVGGAMIGGDTGGDCPEESSELSGCSGEALVGVLLGGLLGAALGAGLGALVGGGLGKLAYDATEPTSLLHYDRRDGAFRVGVPALRLGHGPRAEPRGWINLLSGHF